MTEATQLAPQRCFTHDLFGSDRVLVQDATTLALDLAGFTSLTQRLSGQGTRGTEELSRVLRHYFGAVTDLAVQAGGDPVAFGGDSLSIVFDGPAERTRRAALGVGGGIQALTAATTPSLAPLGSLAIAVRVGIARGTVATGVASSGGRLLPVHVGPGLDLAHATQEAAVTGTVAVHDSAAVRPGRAAPASDPAASAPASVEPTGRAVDIDRLLPPALVEPLRRGRAPAESHRVVTVSFVRFPAVDPGRLHPFLARVARLMTVVDASGGEVVQVSGGDKGVLAMVVFGAPTAHVDDPVRAVHAMLELRHRDPHVAVGVATGPVFAAVLGSRTRMFPTHSGLAVNIAARLSQAAEPGRILVGADTWEDSSRHLRQTGRPRRWPVKGCAAPVVVHEVEGWRSRAPRLASSTLPPLVGRVPELERVERLLDGVTTARGGVLAIGGRPGIGKTRVVQEAIQNARTRGLAVLSSDVADHPRGHLVGWWRELAGPLLGVRRNAPRRAWLDALATALPDGPSQRAMLGPLLGLGGPATEAPLAPDAGLRTTELGQSALGTLVHARSRRGPVLLVVENVDRLDEASLAMLAAVAAAAAGSPSGLLVTRGDDDQPGLGRLTQGVPVLELAPLAEDDTGRLAEQAWRQLGGGTPPSWLPGAVVPRAGGNPLFARMATRALLAAWRPGDPPPAQAVVAGSVAGLLMAQVDPLPAEARELLTVLAVAQRPCGEQLLREVLVPTRSVSEIAQVADRLVAQRLLDRADDGTAVTYRLPHDLLRQVVYDAASHAERERLHRRLVTCLGAAGADPIEVAEHVHHLDDRELATRWYPPAARAARDRWDLTGALRWLDRLQPLSSGRRLELVELERLEVLLVAGRASEVLERLDGATPDQWSVRVDDAATADPPLLTRRLHLLAEATYSCGQLGRAELAASRVMELVDGVDETRYQRAGELLTLSRSHQGDADGAVRAGRVLVDRAVESADPAAQANALAALAVALVLSGRPEAARERYAAALVAAVESGDVVRQIHVLSDLAGCAYLTGRIEECVELLARARKSAETIGYRRHLALDLNNEAQLRATLGDPYASSCAAVAVQCSLELGDLQTAADALHTWLTTKPSLVADPALWRRLVDIDVHLDRSREAATEWADLAVLLARSGRRDAARDAARCGERAAAGPGPVRRRTVLARLLVVAYGRTPPGPAVRSQVLDQLGRLADAPDLDEREAAEIAVERWRLSRTGADHETAVSLARRAFTNAPSAAVRSLFRMLREPVPDVPHPLPPPVGIPRSRTTRRDLERSLAGVEAAVLAAFAPVGRSA
ncbi:MAG: AAA family ATPase [Nocardioidaceae bacterium]